MALKQSFRTDVSAADVVVAATLSGVPAVASGDALALWARVQTPKTSTMRGYLLAYNEGVGWRIFKVTNGSSYSSLTPSPITGLAPVVGWIIRFTVAGSTLTGEYNNGTWHTIDTQTDVSIIGVGTVGLEINGTGPKVSLFDQTTVAAGPQNITLPVVSGGLYVGGELTTTDGDWSNQPSSFAYQWRRDAAGDGVFVDIAAATSKTYPTVQADVGCDLVCVVTATNASGFAGAQSAAFGPVLQAAPVNTDSPTVTGHSRVGVTLSCSTGTWSPAATSYTYQWYRAGASTSVPISGATSSSYVVVSGDLGLIVFCRVTATNAGGSTVAEALVDSPVVDWLDQFNRANEDPLSGGGTWTGPMQSGYVALKLASNVLAAHVGAGSSSESYRTDITSADVAVDVFVPTLPGAGDAIAIWSRIQNPGTGSLNAYLFVYFTNTGFAIYKCVAGSFSALTTPIAAHTLATGEGLRLNVQGSHITGYWLATDGTANRVIAVDDFDVTGAGTVGLEINSNTCRLDDFATSLLSHLIAGTAVVTGPILVGGLLSVFEGAWFNATGFTYQWQHDTAGNGIYADIGGATASTYTVQTSDTRDHIRCKVTGTDGVLSLTSTSAAVGPVVGFVSIDGGTGRLPALLVDVDVTNDPTSSTRTWTEITTLVRQLSFVRSGRTDERQRTEGGTLTALLDNRNDAITNLGLRKAQWFRVQALWAGVVYPLWQGVIESLPRKWPQAGFDATVEVQASDVLKILRFYDLADETFPMQRNDERIATIAGLVSLDYTVDTNTDDADIVSTPLTEGTEALSYSLAIEESEGGLLIAEPDGTLTFQGRHWRILNGAVSVGTFGESAGEIPYRDSAVYDDDDTRIANIVSVTPLGGTAVVVEDATSQARYWTRRLTRSLITSDTNIATDAANYLVGRYADPSPRIPTLDVQLAAVSAKDPLLVPAVLGAANSDRFTWSRDAPTPISDDVFVEQVGMTITPGLGWEVRLQCSPASDEAGWVLGDAVLGVLGSTTRLVY